MKTSTNTLTVVTAYSSISPKPCRKAYLNSSEELATQRFLREFPAARDLTVVVLGFEDEFTIRPNGTLAAY
ncbi:hypothetical protein F5984_21905 [Rudanella paleaurantiibacter]|uniref:Uncharacterized protein n=1 Tax=Rudanella paleaurantiibacter TaxID=2614655 RepID=A0A7J5TTS2_9BACT|nr:hypothetical protein [Rudanella paleaurantiibacter]KAB7727285.1 hypothetical protein F5984_21905 [Rudanella paleaurantiibacter]